MKNFKTVLIVNLTIILFLISARMLIYYEKTNEIILPVFITYLVIINLYSFIIMFIDKNKSTKLSKQRISERHLFVSAALGGSLGSLIGMKLARHKTKHLQFILLLPSIFVIEAVSLFYFLR